MILVERLIVQSTINPINRRNWSIINRQIDNEDIADSAYGTVCAFDPIRDPDWLSDSPTSRRWRIPG